MPGRISDTVIQQIRDRVNLAELIGQQVKLRKSGRNYVGLCPFHADGSPSFSVSVEKGFYFCHGCHESGDAFSFMQKARGMSFMESVESLAGTLGIELEFDDTDRAHWNQARERKRLLLECNREAHSIFRTALVDQDGHDARAYLEGRGIQRRMLSLFQVGYAPRDNRIHRTFSRRGLSLSHAADTGLVMEGRRGLRDRFLGRVIFPVLTVGDEIAGFSARALPGGPEPKYLNSPDSEVFKKGDLLFGLVQAREAMKKEDRCILVEGQLDVVALHQAGIACAVAPLGTALTEDQAAMLRRFTPNVVLMFDGDEAGRKAIWRGLTVLMNQGLYGKVVRMPDGEDPDSILRASGPEEVARLVEGARPFLEYAVETLVAGAAGGMHGRSEAARAGMDFAGHISNAIDRRVFLEQLASELSLSPESLRVQAVRPVAGAPRAPEPELEVPRKERKLLWFALQQPELARMFSGEEVFDLVQTPAVREFFVALLDEFEEYGEVDVRRYVAGMADSPLKEILAELLMAGPSLDPVALKRLVEETIASMRRGRLKTRLQQLGLAIRKAEGRGELDEALELNREREEVWRELATVSNPTGP